MGGEGEIWRGVKAQIKAKRQKNAATWLELLKLSGMPFTATNRGETLLFREANKPPVDFWPSTGKWRVAKPDGKTFNGGAQAFLNWYRKQNLNHQTAELENRNV